MNVLLVHHAWPPSSAGGSETYMRALARALARRHRVSVVHREADPDRPDHALRESLDGPVRVIALNNLHRENPGFEAWDDAGVTRRFAEIVREIGPDVVHVGHLSGLSAGLVHAARAAGAAVVFTLHDFATLCPLGQLLDVTLHVCPGPDPHRCLRCVGAQVATPVGLARAGARLRGIPGAGLAAGLLARGGRGSDRIAARLAGMRDVLRSADALVSPSRFLRDRMGALGVGGIEVLPYGHETLPVVPREPAPPGQVRFGFLGSAIPSKGLHVLAEAYRGLADPRARLSVHGPFVPYHGDDGYAERVRGILGPLAAEALKGPFPHESRAHVLAGLDVLVAPSLWEENAPLVVQEAFQAGLPVIVSGHGGLAEAVRHEVDGLHVRPGDGSDLRRAMRRFLDEPGLRDRLAAAVPAVVTMDEHLPALEAVYERARERYARRAGRIGVVVVDHGRPEDAAAALASADDPVLAPRLLVVGNGTPPPSTPLSRASGLHLAQNRGYAGGANAGFRRLLEEGCDRVLLLNNDARLRPGALRLLAEALEDPGLAAVGPTVRREGVVESRGMRLDLRSGRHRMLEQGTPDVLSGAAVMVRASAFEVVGGLDEDYFHGFEDADFCLRARRAGFGIAVVRRAEVDHGSGATLGRSAPQPLYYAARNHLRLVQRLAPRRSPARALNIVGLHLAHAVRQGAVPRLAALRAVLRGVRDYRRGRFGPLEPA
jgi:GT2 family glycosyltransferase/glycosyltransferase involved in cell wall biosynthesis